MAYWITHMMIADNLLATDLELDARGFCVGSIAPDCNIESPDWTSFEPSREITHFMSGESKLSADYDAFYQKYIAEKSFSSEEERSFMLGYYTHLITDVEFSRFVRNEERVSHMYGRIKNREDVWAKVKGLPESFDTVKLVFDKDFRTRDIVHIEQKYILDNPSSSYNTILRKTEQFPDYLDLLPCGAISRKIPIMAYEVKDLCDADFIVFTEEEYGKFVSDTAKLICDKLQLIFDEHNIKSTS